MKHPHLLAHLGFLAAATIGFAAPPAIVDYTVKLDVIHSGFDGVHCWVHPRAGIIPGPQPIAVMTMLKLTVTGSDLFSPTWDVRSDDLGRTWSDPFEHRETLGHRSEPGGVIAGICDFTPQFHAASGKLLAIGHTVRYRNHKVLDPRARETAYSVYDPAARRWTAVQPKRSSRSPCRRP